MITLTEPDGTKFEIDPDKISVIMPAFAANPGAKTIVRVDGENHAVRETSAEIAAMRAK